MDISTMRALKDIVQDPDDASAMVGQMGSVRFSPEPFGKDIHRIDGRQLDLQALIMAKTEYMNYLVSILSKGIREGLIAQHETSIDQSSSYATEIDTYQRVLRQTKLWNTHIIAKETERVLGSNKGIFPNLLAAIYVSQVKILASVKVTKGSSTVQITIPSSESFVHAVYIECARILFNNPLLIYIGKNHSPQKVCERNANVDKVVTDGVNEAVRIMLPVKDILYEYLNGTMLQNAIFSMGDDFEAYMKVPYQPQITEEEHRPYEEPERMEVPIDEVPQHRLPELAPMPESVPEPDPLESIHVPAPEPPVPKPKMISEFDMSKFTGPSPKREEFKDASDDGSGSEIPSDSDSSSDDSDTDGGEDDDDDFAED